MRGLKLKKALKAILISVAIILPIILGSFTIEAFASQKSLLDAKLFELKDGWQYQVPGINEWVPAKCPYISDSRLTDNIVTMKVLLPRKVKRGFYLHVKCKYQDLEAYCNGTMIYSCGSLDINSSGSLPGYYWHNIPMTSSYSGKEIVLKLRLLKINNSSSIIGAYIGCPSAFFITQLKQDIKIAIPGLILIISGVFTLMIYICKRRRILVILSLSMFSMSVGIHSIAVTSVTKDFIYNNSAFWYYVLYISSFMMPVFFLMAVNLVFKGVKRRIMKYIWLFFTIFTAFSTISDVINFIPFSNSFKVYIVFLAVAIPVASILIYTTAATGNIYHKILRNCYTILVITGVIDMTAMFIINKPSEISLTSFGALLFLLSIFFLLERSVYEAEEKISLFSDEIKQKDATLVESQKLLQQTLESEKVKSEYFANVSHEFRTPLNILLSNLQLMNHYVNTGEIKSDKKDIRKYITTMKQNCYRLLKLINNVIDLSKIDSGYMSPIIKNCDIVNEIKSIVLSVSEYAESKGLTLKFHSDAPSFITACDPEKLERIMLNLLSNAVKFTEKDGNITVLMNFSPEKLTITVSDTGIGIPEDKLSAIFNRFSQVDMALSKSYEGSGIGLSLVRSLVEMLGGYISVQSKPGKGSDFIITLPVKLAEDADGNISSALSMQKCINESINIEFSDISK